MFQKGVELFACPDVDIAEIMAKEYIKQMRLTKQDVKIFRYSGLVVVRTIRDIE